MLLRINSLLFEGWAYISQGFTSLKSRGDRISRELLAK